MYRSLYQPVLAVH